MFAIARRKRLFRLLAAPLLLALAPSTAFAAEPGQRVRVSGELVDTWCNVSGLMFGLGTAHHQCAVWCTLGGIPVSIRDKAGNFYLILRIEEDEQSVSNPRIARIQSHEVEVDGELIERDGVKYLFITKVADDKGVINLTHAEHGIQPFGN